MLNSMIEAFTLGTLIIMAISPAVFLLCICKETWQKVVAVCFFVVSLAGFIGLKYQYDQNPPQNITLNNYGEEIR